MRPSSFPFAFGIALLCTAAQAGTRAGGTESQYRRRRPPSVQMRMQISARRPYSLRHRWVPVLAAVLTLVVAVAMIPLGLIKFEFIPASDNGQIGVTVGEVPGQFVKPHQVGPRTNFRASTPIHGVTDSATARSTQFRNSRTLPHQGCSSSACSAAGVKP